ncbi:Maf family protein [Patescibacteria group bacterium]
MKLVLASQSPWRKKLLSWLVVDFDVVVSDFDERSVEIKNPGELVEKLALEKAKVVAKTLGEGVVIGADTVIVVGDEIHGDLRILGKPDDINHAREILSSLRGKTHQVYTGVAVVDVLDGKEAVEVDVTKMKFKEFSNEVLESYLETGDSMGKAGAYQFLKIAKNFVDGYEGSVTGVIGLPLGRLKRMLGEMGVDVGVNTEEIVMKEIGFKD